MHRIGYDAKRLFNNFTGLGNYSRTLLRNLATYYPDEEYFLFTPTIKRTDQTKYFLDSPMYSVQMPANIRRLLWRSWGMTKDLHRHKIDLYHGLSHEIPYSLRGSGIASVVTIHDLIFKHYPEQYQWTDRLIYDQKFRYACDHADHIVAISESTKQDIMHFYGTPEEKITVVYQSCHEGFITQTTAKAQNRVLEKYQIPDTYLLYVGSLIARKNLLGIIEAMRRLPTDLQLPLVIVGRGEAYKKQVIELAARYHISHLLHFIAPAFADLPALYQHAQIFLFPSFYEGFGIPVLEALFSETPVITSNVSSLPEAAGPGASLVDPASPDAMADAIVLLLTDEERRAQQVAAGYAHAQQFHGEALTDQMMDVYEAVLG